MWLVTLSCGDAYAVDDYPAGGIRGCPDHGFRGMWLVEKITVDDAGNVTWRASEHVPAVGARPDDTGPLPVVEPR